MRAFFSCLMAVLLMLGVTACFPSQPAEDQQAGQQTGAESADVADAGEAPADGAMAESTEADTAAPDEGSAPAAEAENEPTQVASVDPGQQTPGAQPGAAGEAQEQAAQSLPPGLMVPPAMREADASLLLQEWQLLAMTPEKSVSNPMAAQLGAAMVMKGEEAVQPLFQALKERSVDPQVKRLVLVTLRQVVSNEHLPALKDVVDSDVEGTGRAVAAFLIGSIQSDEATEVLETLVDDPESRVAVTAEVALLYRQPDKYATTLVERAIDPETDERQREEIISNLTALDNPVIVGDLLTLASSSEMQMRHRVLAVDAIGRLGGPDVIPELKALEDDPEFGQNGAIFWAIENIEQRSAQADS